MYHNKLDTYFDVFDTKMDLCQKCIKEYDEYHNEFYHHNKKLKAEYFKKFMDSKPKAQVKDTHK